MRLPFATLFADTLTNRSAYRALRRRKIWYGLRYLYFLLVLLSVLGTVRMIVLAAGLTSNVPIVEQQKQLVKGLYPDELVIRIQSGSVSTNMREPYAVALPPQWKRWIDEDNGRFENLLVIDTNAGIDEFPRQKTILLLTKNSVVHPSRRGGSYESTPIDPAMTMTIDHDSYQAGLTHVMPYVDRALSAAKGFLVLWLLIGPFITAFVLLLWYMLYLVFSSLLVWVIDSTFLKRGLRFEEIYTLSLFGITLPLIVTFILKQFGMAFPLLFTVLMVGWMTSIVSAFPTKRSKAT